MATDVIFTDEFGAWFDRLSEAEQDRVYRSVGLLEAYGVTLPFPHSNKTGDEQFYSRMIPVARKIWNEYLDETGQKKPKTKK